MKSLLSALLVSILVISGCDEVDRSLQPAQSRQDTLRSLSYEQRLGKHLYIRYCAVCHGETGKGDGFNAYNLEPRPRDFTDVRYMNALSDAHLIETIKEGGRGVNKSPLMPSWEGRLKKDEVEYVVSYVRTFIMR